MIYVATVATAAVAMLVVAAVVAGPPRSPNWVIALIVVGLLASVGRPQAIGPMQLSISAIIEIAAIPLVGAVGAGLISAVPVLTDRNESVKRVFNAAQRVLLALAGSLVYHAAGGEVLHDGLGDMTPLDLAVAMAAASAVAGLANTVLLAGVLQTSSAGSFTTVSRTLIPRTSAAYATSVVAAYLLVILWSPAELGWVSALFFLPSLIVIQWGLRQHAAEWATRQRVLTPFVRALDLRRPGAAEESRLGAGAAQAMALGIGLSPTKVDEVTTAARLRDVGYLVLDRAPEAIARRDHSLVAREVLGPVSFLEGSLEMIDAHHERIDGLGYPNGLADDAIPIGPRVVAVADMWARLVAAGTDRGAAVARCEESAGTGLDRECVAALRRALERDQLPGAAG